MKVNVISNFSTNVNKYSNHNKLNQKISFGYGDYGFEVNPNPEDDCAEQKQTLWEGIKGTANIIGLIVCIPFRHLHDKATGRLPKYSDIERLEAEYDLDDFEENYPLSDDNSTEETSPNNN